MFNEVKKHVDWNGEILELSTGKIARQADGAVMVKMGGTIVQCTVVSAKSTIEGINFTPLTVNYQERAYAAGKIPGGFFKREGRGTEKEILVSRLIDRAIRPLFHPGFFRETQILCTVHSFDMKHSPEILALIGASAALAISGIPCLDVVVASKVGLIDGKFVINPSCDGIKNSQLELVVAGTRDSIMMVESEADFLTEEQMIEAIRYGHTSIQPVIDLVQELKAAEGKSTWPIPEFVANDLKEEMLQLVQGEIVNAFAIKAKQARYAEIAAISEKMIKHFTAEERFAATTVTNVLEEIKSDILRTTILDKKIRIDGRELDEIRQIKCEVRLFPGAHGSALFTRGETQAIVATTLGIGQDEQMIDGIEGEYKESFMLNYIFPGYSVGEAVAMRGPSRREVGHAKLAWRALKAALPTRVDFPYTIRVVSEISESNGSSSMATVCGGSMSMMDAGIPLKTPIAGIAMGLIKEKDNFVVLSDILGDEDHLGDMDFKVAGSKDGVTALQMDIKVAGITFAIIEQALAQAKQGRIHILEQMNKVISASGTMSTGVPLIESFAVPKEKIREIIGAGGKVIREICDTTGAKIDITDEGIVSISAVGQDKLDAAVKKVKEIAIDPEIGDVFEGVVVKVLDAGAFVNYLGSKDGFVHISEISHDRIDTVASVLSEGAKITVKLIGFDRGKAKLTIKNATSAPNPTNTASPTNTTNATNPSNSGNSSSSNSEKSAQDAHKEQKIRKDKNTNKKWKSKSDEPNSSSDKISERKYFN